jgi:hypothetical protein
MLETFIIDGSRVEIDVSYKIFTADLLEVTSFTDSWRNYIHSGRRFLKLQGKLIGEGEIKKVYQIIGTKADVLVLKSLAHI